MLRKGLVCLALIAVGIEFTVARELPVFLKRRNYSDALPEISSTLDPCTNFYGYSCNAWIKQVRKPPFEPTWNPWIVVAHKIKHRLSQILTLHDPNLAQAQIFYRSCVNTADHEQKYLAKFKTFVDDLGGWSLIKNKQVNYDWLHQLAKITRVLGIHPVLKIHVDLDYKDTRKFAIYVEPGDLIFPQYILTGSDYRTELKAYEEWILETAYHISDSKLVNKESVKDIVKFEMHLAGIRENNKRIQKTTLQKLSQKFSVDWVKFFNNIFGRFSTVTPNSTVIIKNYTYLKKLFLLIDQMGTRVVEDYLMWSVIKDFSRDTDRHMRNLNFLINQAVLGIKEDITREYECLDKVVTYFSPLLLPRYLKLYVNPRILLEVTSMVEAVKNEFVKILMKCDWLSQEAKLLVVDKVKQIKLFLGYPAWDLHKDSFKRYYGKLQMTNDHFMNLIKLKHFKTSHHLSRVADQKPKTLWPSSPFDVNAYYSILQNSIFVPLGMLEPPFYQYKRDDIFNYGALGSLIGHEISHSLDPVGIMANSMGQIGKWLPEHDLELYRKKIQCYNSSVTTGENIADLNGLKISLNAFKTLNLSQKTDLFFFSFAQMWCEVSENTDIFAGDEHAAGFVRVQNMVNIEDFRKVFKCGFGPSCEIW